MEKFPFQGKIIDITTPISSSTQVFPGDPVPAIEQVCTLETEGFAVSELLLGSHTGTHVDAPSHILSNTASVDKLKLENLMGEALLLDFSHLTGELTAGILEKAFEDARISKETSILLLKTKTSCKTKFSKHKNAEDPEFHNSEVNFQDTNGKQEKLDEADSTGRVNPADSADPANLGESAAIWIVEKGFKAVGTDSLSIDNLYSEDLPVHNILLSNNVNIIEGLELSLVKEGTYFFLCLPLKIEGCDGAPARALLISY
ncbi:MAG: cyclase family protein [Methanosarcina sp.]